MKYWKSWPIKKLEYDDFPKSLKGIKCCPKFLYYRGNFNPDIFANSVSIVGSRNMTRYGKETVAKFVPDLVLNKVSVISGFMYGIDSEAHRICIENGGTTVAVLGGGLDILLPAENDDLYTKILNQNGLVISEYEPDFKPTLWSFPQRNRIVSGLSSKGVLVIEAGLKSGSLITARIAKEQKKKVYAIPGPINSKSSEGTNYLIKNNLAKLVTSIEDILNNSKVLKYQQENIFMNDLTILESKIINLLRNEEMTVDEIARVLNKSIEEISESISLMSLRNLIEEESGKIFISTAPN